RGSNPRSWRRALEGAPHQACAKQYRAWLRSGAETALGLREDLVDLASRVGEDLRDLLDLRLVARPRGLHRGSDELEPGLAELLETLRNASDVPRLNASGTLAALLELLPAPVGERV